ncbi:hypothetical protein [Bradyrhizobium sp. CCGUVB23]|uniref:hypothetical protein n=1 Tax=Bradyrhizobium sp. CCGUVB23 TaxID=2949630 RepID=UPI0020B4010A|nr:hypothetical protein [Bradyrhizobium sp. CCGUVB23]MCP3468652.1 hypothetical protein [Bradyrhizobium sp. CCGUVB23]
MNREEGSGTHEDESLAGSSGRVGEPSSGRRERSNTLAASSSADSQIAGAFPPDAAMHEDFDDLTEDDWSRIDELLLAINREEGSGTHEDESLAGSSGRVGEPSSGRRERSNTLAASSSADSQIAGAFPPDAAMHDNFDDLTEDDWSRIDESMWSHGDTPVVDKGKAKSDVHDVALPATAIGHPSEAMPRSVPLRTFERVEVGDDLLIGHESNSEWSHAMLFETPQQHFRRVGRWLDKEEYDQMSVLIKTDDPKVRTPRESAVLAAWEAAVHREDG